MTVSNEPTGHHHPLPRDARHLSMGTLDALWSAGHPVELPVVGAPPCWLRLDPARRSIALLTGHQYPEPDLARLRNVTYQALAADDGDLAEILVSVTGNVHGAYGLLAGIADQLQVEGAPLAAAVAAGVERHRAVLAARTGLTIEQEIGLYGELLLLEHLIAQTGAESALAAWQGPAAEEHDYVLDRLDLEVKTTVSERRRHTVHGLTQLVPVHDTPLSLVSIQLTRTAPGQGRSLPELIGHVRHNAAGHVVTLDRRLAALGWDPEDADLCPTIWRLRTRPRAYLVDAQFPAITPDTLRHVPYHALVEQVTYRIDVTDLTPYTPAHPVAGFVESTEDPPA